MNRLKLNVLLIALFSSMGLFGQNSIAHLTFKSNDDKQRILDNYASQMGFTDSLTAIKGILQIKNALQEDGYLTASLDSVSVKQKTFVAHMFVGRRYKWGKLEVSGIPADWRKSSIGKKMNQPINGEDYSDSFAKLIGQANDNGFPFATAELDSLKVIDQSIHGLLRLETGPLIRFDTLDINGSPSRKKYLSTYLRTSFGSLYSERKVNQIPDYFENLPYYDLISPVQLLFHNDEARLGIEVERIKANRFDGIIGLLPNSARDGKTLVTGELNLELLNPFESGKELKIHWQRLREESQSLDVGIRLPHFLKTPVDLVAVYRQLKEDTTFINRNAKFGGEVGLTPISF